MHRACTYRQAPARNEKQETQIAFLLALATLSTNAAAMNIVFGPFFLFCSPDLEK